MHAFYERMSTREALRIDRLARLLIELREGRAALLQGYGCDDEAALLSAVAAGELAEHPAYEHYLGARVLNATRAAVRTELGAGKPAPDVLHLRLRDLVEERYGERLVDFPNLRQDALSFRFDTGLALQARYAAADEYAFAWSWGDAARRIDTAPVHRELQSFPNHMHDERGRVRADTLTSPDSTPWDNLRRLIEALLEDPLPA